MVSKLLAIMMSVAFTYGCKTSQMQNSETNSLNPNSSRNGEEEFYVAVEASMGKDLAQSEARWAQVCEKYEASFKNFFKERFVSFNCLGGHALMERDAKTKPECVENEDGQEVLTDCFSEGLLTVQASGPRSSEEPRVFIKTKDIFYGKKDEYAGMPADEVAVDLCIKLQMKAQKDYGAAFVGVNCANAGRWGGESLYWYQAEGNARLLDSLVKTNAGDVQEVYVAVETQKNEKRWQQICGQFQEAFKAFFKERFVRFDCLEGAKLMDHEVLPRPECIDTGEDGDLLNGCNSEGLLVVKAAGRAATEEPRLVYQTEPINAGEKDEYQNRQPDEVSVDLCIKLQALGQKDFSGRFIAASCDGSGRTISDAKTWYEAEGKAKLVAN